MYCLPVARRASATTPGMHCCDLVKRKNIAFGAHHIQGSAHLLYVFFKQYSHNNIKAIVKRTDTHSRELENSRGQVGMVTSKVARMQQCDTYGYELHRAL